MGLVKRKFSIPLLFVLPLLFWGSQAMAQIDPHLIPVAQPSGCNITTGEFGYNCIPLYVAYLIKTVFSFIGTLCLLQIIYGGYQIALGSLLIDKEKGWNRIKAAVGGLLVSVFCFAIVDMIIAVVIP